MGMICRITNSFVFSDKYLSILKYLSEQCFVLASLSSSSKFLKFDLCINKIRNLLYVRNLPLYGAIDHVFIAISTISRLDSCCRTNLPLIYNAKDKVECRELMYVGRLFVNMHYSFAFGSLKAGSTRTVQVRT